MEVRINKEVRDYQERLFFGLDLRQFVFSVLAVAAAVGVYFALHGALGSAVTGWLCVLAAAPFAFGGFFQFNGMTFGQFAAAWFRSVFCYSKRLVYRSDNMYVMLLKNSSIKEALSLD